MKSVLDLQVTTGNVLFYWILIPLLKIGVVMAILPLLIAVATLAERKIIAWMQVRVGPMRVGPHGALQPIADVVKLLLKEDVIPSGANRFVFMLAPILVVAPAFVVFSVVPFGPAFDWAHTPGFSLLAYVANWLHADISADIPLYITDLDIGLLFIVAVSSLGVIGILLAGWASNSKYPLLGGLRAAAQLISYEVPLGFGLIAALMMLGTLSMPKIIQAQVDMGLPLFLLQPVSLFLYLVGGVAETNRVPFDLPEAETELVAGFHTEYSGMRFAFFFLAEYANMITVAAIAATVFLGGWLPPFWFLMPAGLRQGLLWGPLPLAWLVLKIVAIYYLYYWLRATLPRYRYDQLMRLGWKWLIPLSLANVFMVGLTVVALNTYKLPTVYGIGFAAVDILVVLATLYIFRSAKGKYDEETFRASF